MKALANTGATSCGLCLEDSEVEVVSEGDGESQRILRQSHPGGEPSAHLRFLRDIEDTRSKLGIGDDELIRAR